MIREEPRSLNELLATRIAKRRTLLRDLKELKELGDIEFDKAIGRYISVDARRVFSVEDLKLALEHSKVLLFTTEHEQLFDQMDLYVAVDELAFCPSKYEFLLCHFKTGYFKEVWEPLTSYRDLMEKHNFLGVSATPEILEEKIKEEFGLIPWEERTYEEQVKIMNKYPSLDPNSKTARELEESVPPDAAKQLSRLREQLIKELSFIVAQVKHGIPLKGYCKLCPSEYIEIRRIPRASTI